MAGDDCSLHFDLDALTEKQRADHLSNIELTAMLQVALACVGHHKDHLALFDTFQSDNWLACLTLSKHVQPNGTRHHSNGSFLLSPKIRLL